MDELFGVPSTYPNDLRGTCYDIYGGQEYMNFNFSDHHTLAVAGKKTAINYEKSTASTTTGNRRVLFNEYDLLMGANGGNQT